MPELYSVKVLRPCVVNRAPREPGDIVELVSVQDKNGLVYHKKVEVVDSVDAAIVAANKRAKAAEAKAESDPEPKKKAAKKAANKAARKAD
jgi:hypothetical protein